MSITESPSRYGSSHSHEAESFMICIDRFADLVAERVANRLTAKSPPEDRWLTTAEAAEYLGLPSANALHRLTSERKVPFSQDRPGAKCWFKRSDLDAWRSP